MERSAGRAERGALVQSACQQQKPHPQRAASPLHLLVQFTLKPETQQIPLHNAFRAGDCELKASIVCKDYFLASSSFKETRIFTHFSIDPC